METGIFPDHWKKAKVHPIFKSDERNIPSKTKVGDAGDRVCILWWL